MELEDTATGLPGLTHKYMVSSSPTWHLDNMTARIFASDFTNAVRIQANHDGLNVRKVTLDKEQSNFNFALGLGVRHLFTDLSYLLDKDNYEVEPAQFKITDVNDEAKFTECDFFQHPICVQMVVLGQHYAPQLTLKLKNKVPKWVSECSYNKRLGTLPESHQSYAIYEMVEGIYNAFYNSMDTNSRDIFQLQVKFEGYE